MAEPPVDQKAAMATTKLRSADVRVDLQLTLKEAVAGCTREINVKRNEPCGTCEASGVVPGTSVVDCSDCGGTGRIMRRQGGRVIQQRCDHCIDGKLGTACEACDGAGVHSRICEVSVTLPAGVERGQTLRLHGKGDAIRGGKRGDLYVVLGVQPLPREIDTGEHGDPGIVKLRVHERGLSALLRRWFRRGR